MVFRLLRFLLGGLLFLALAVAGGAIYLWHHYGQDLPDETQLAGYSPAIVTRAHAGDGRLLAEFWVENRVFVPIDEIPKRVIHAFLAAEDKSFYDHPGIDVVGMIRAGVSNLQKMGTGARPEGASTITQQVAKNFLLSSEVSIERKIKEIILAFRIESAFTKDQILELYLNEIYLGAGNYGVVTAALNYFNKSLDELSIAEAAFLAALPKAPNNYHPTRQKKAAIERRNWIIGRMAEDGYVTPQEAKQARDEDLVVRARDQAEVVRADYFAEEVRRAIQRLYGDDMLYKGGLVVRTTLDPELQAISDRVLREGLITYDRRHGWRGPLARMALSPEAMTTALEADQAAQAKDPEAERPPLPVDATDGDWQKVLASLPLPPLPKVEVTGGWRLAVALEVGDKTVEIGLPDGSTGTIPMKELSWARAWKPEQRVGGEPKKPSEVLAAGDIVLVERVTKDPDGKDYGEEGLYGLRQIPDVEGAFVAMDPHTGRVLAITGGWSYEESEFDRAMQAQRQPGSSFKPFVYITALDQGFTPATVILDAPFVLDQGPGQPKWKPKNYSNKFYGPTVMRVGIEKSRNLMTVRLAQTVGMPNVVDYSRRFGVADDMPAVLSMALGATETTLLKMVAGYSMIANGGKKITPTLIDRIQDRYGKIVYRHDDRYCEGCIANAFADQAPPELPDWREQLADPISAYQMVSMLQGVVQRGTGARVAVVNKPIAGKTGTTNDNFDTWFVGFTPDLAAGVFVGFDQPRTLGPNDTGSTVASPIFRDFMLAALEDVPAKEFHVPEGVVFVPINQQTGMIASGPSKGVVVEAFKPGSEPIPGQQVLDGGYTPGAEDNTVIGVPGVY